MGKPRILQKGAFINRYLYLTDYIIEHYIGNVKCYFSEMEEITDMSKIINAIWIEVIMVYPFYRRFQINDPWDLPDGIQKYRCAEGWLDIFLHFIRCVKIRYRPG